MQQEARDNLRRTEPVNDPQFGDGSKDAPFPGFDWMPMPEE
jgi:hypothetical protein